MSSIETIYGRPIVWQSFGRGIAKAVKTRLSLWFESYRTRQQLQDLPDSALEDLGLSREAVRAEAGRPFWDSERFPR